MNPIGRRQSVDARETRIYHDHAIEKSTKQALQGTKHPETAENTLINASLPHYSKLSVICAVCAALVTGSASLRMVRCFCGPCVMHVSKQHYNRTHSLLGYACEP